MKCPIDQCSATFKTKQSLTKHLRLFTHSPPADPCLFLKCLYCSDWKIALLNPSSKEALIAHLEDASIHASIDDLSPSVEFFNWLNRLDPSIIGEGLEDCTNASFIPAFIPLMSHSSSGALYFVQPCKKKIQCPFHGCSKSEFSTFAGFKYHAAKFVHVAACKEQRVLVPFWFAEEGVEEFLVFSFESGLVPLQRERVKDCVNSPARPSIEEFVQGVLRDSRPFSMSAFKWDCHLESIEFMGNNVVVSEFEFTRVDGHLFGGVPVGFVAFKVAFVSCELFIVAARVAGLLVHCIPRESQSFIGIYSSESGKIVKQVYFPFVLVDFVIVPQSVDESFVCLGVSSGHEIFFVGVPLTGESLISFDFNSSITKLPIHSTLLTMDYNTGMLVCGFFDGTLQIWNLEHSRTPLVHLPTFHFGPIKSLSLNGNWKVASLGQDGSIFSADLNDLDSYGTLRPVLLQRGCLPGSLIKILRDDHVISCEAISDLRACNLDRYEEDNRSATLLRPAGMMGKSSAFVFDGEAFNGKMLVGSDEGQLWIVLDNSKRYKKNTLLFGWKGRHCSRLEESTSGLQVTGVAFVNDRVLYALSSGIVHCFSLSKEPNYLLLLDKKK